MPSDTATRTLEDVVQTLRGLFGDAIVDATVNELGGGQLIVKAAAERRPDVMQTLKDLGFTFYTFCCGVDWPDDDRIEVLDHVYDVEHRHRVTVKYDVARDAPRIPSVAGVYAGADWHERETWELFGVVFAGHPRLRRLLLPDWFEGFPMRKDYELPARAEKPWPGDFFSG